MGGKAAFWAGMALSLVGGVLIVFATGEPLMHGLGVLGVIFGLLLAIRNFRA